jgi:hypothetical protein
MKWTGLLGLLCLLPGIASASDAKRSADSGPKKGSQSHKLSDFKDVDRTTHVAKIYRHASPDPASQQEMHTLLTEMGVRSGPLVTRRVLPGRTADMSRVAQHLVELNHLLHEGEGAGTKKLSKLLHEGTTMPLLRNATPVQEQLSKLPKGIKAVVNLRMANHPRLTPEAQAQLMELLIGTQRSVDQRVTEIKLPDGKKMLLDNSTK